jgi:siroheme decarboxylase
MEIMQRRLLNDFQRDFPLVPEPFLAIAERLGVTESEVLTRLAYFQIEGRISRVGVVFRPNTVGVSTLAALAVPERLLAQTAKIVNAFPEVNHNYEREHAYNLWFVITAGDAGRLQQVLTEIESATGLNPLYLPLEREYHIDLGFDLNGGNGIGRPFAGPVSPSREPGAPERDHTLLASLQDGFPLVSRPFSRIGVRSGLSEDEVIARLRDWVESGVARRIGIVVRHHELGWRANAMAVWDVPDERVDEIGERMARQPIVTLCYRRPRRLPDWRYNLFCMIHGRDPQFVRGQVEALRIACELDETPHQVLFSRQRFKQTGARYAA